ncbi:DUF1802 family protein [Gorillibacterium sp. sgz500922]|uniref:DUF1802 family protein n=1 Tax=Gorillibacterium sp. sgz500922 TaxID=3446694 RepID=UPI003F67109F
MEHQMIALKEWAVTIRALSEGRQILLLRKGGIAEETRDFQLETPSFYLYPTYEHQRGELLKDEFRPLLSEVLADWKPEEETVEIAYRAVAEADLEVTSEEELNKLRDLHIWTEAFAEEKLRWKKSKPLHVLLLRVYRLEQPLRLPVLPQYGGCKSWVRLEAEAGGGKDIPVLDEAGFKKAAEEVRLTLETR